MKRILSLLLCLMLLACCITSVSAASTTQATEKIDTSKTCTLDVSYKYGDVTLSGETISLYKVASVNADMVYTLDETFEKLNVTFTDVENQKAYDQLNITASGLVLANKVKADYTAVTDANGVAHFEGLSVGMYMVSNLCVLKGEKYYTVESFLVSTPTVGADGKWIYNVTSQPKATTDPEPTKGLRTYKVVVAFVDKGNEDKRPESVEITIVRKGKAPEKVTLTAEKNWTYEWTEVDDGTEISVIEENVPEGYTYATSRLGDVFTVTNTYVEPTPKDGDNVPVTLLIAVMAISGAALIALGVAGKKRNKA